LLVFVMGLGAASLAEARDQLVMPFDCGFERGHVRLSPSAERRYFVVGGREERAFTACRPQLPVGCHTITVHRFAISCGGASVPWIRVAAAIRHVGTGPAWIKDGRLNLMLPARNRPAARPSCFDGPAFANAHAGTNRRIALYRDCVRASGYDHVVLPAGFAPLGELGARLLVATGIEAANAAQVAPAASLPTAPTILARADHDTLVEPIVGLKPHVLEAEEALAIDEWVTVVRAETDPVGAAREAGSPAAWALLLAALALAVAAGLVRAGTSYVWVASPFAPAARLGKAVAAGWRGLRSVSSTENSTNAGAALAVFLEQTETVVSGLKEAGPLREVLQSELKLVRQRLLSTESAAVEDEVAAARAAPLFRALIHDLERIRRIAESAAASLSRGRQPSLPRTASEAYDALGVNPDVSEGVLKKIVDALRMSWHPDHARDEEDRRVREDRIRQINIAWDLISGKREAA
jgi:hypothetical protein